MCSAGNLSLEHGGRGVRRVFGSRVCTVPLCGERRSASRSSTHSQRVRLWRKLLSRQLFTPRVIHQVVGVIMLSLTLSSATVPSSAGGTPRAAGILYELWHCEAATAMAQVKARALPQRTTETVIRSNGRVSLDDVYPRTHGPFASSDIFNAEPAELGFYCLCSKRTENDTLPDCPGAAAVARRHADLITSAGFDYVALDITNWPQVNAATDVAILRPLEVLFDQWIELRRRGVPTPAIAAWCVSPVAAYTDVHETTWQWLLDHVYNNATRAPLLWSRVAGKQTFFLPATTAYNATIDALIQSNGGRDNIDTIKMWALSVGKGSSTWGFFSPCTQSDGSFTTSMVGTGPCNQFPAMDGDTIVEVSASGGYMVQAARSNPWLQRPPTCARQRTEHRPPHPCTTPLLHHPICALTARPLPTLWCSFRSARCRLRRRDTCVG